jgi:tetratricopeptide (TPR) repeat protein
MKSATKEQMGKRPKRAASRTTPGDQGKCEPVLPPVVAAQGPVAWVSRRKNLAALIAVALAVVLCYVNTLDNDFIHDDKVEILGNRNIKDLSHISEIFSAPAWAFDNTRGPKSSSNYYRPVQYLSYALLYRVFGPAAWGYHLAKLAGHLAVCLLFFWTISVYWKDYWLGLLSAMLFAVHPVNSEAVAWISGITDVSGAFFFLLCWYFFLRYRSSNSTSDWAALQLSFFIGLFCKEFMVTLIPLLLLFEMIELRRFPSPPRLLRIYAPLSAAFAVYVFFRIRAIGGFTFEGQYHFGNLTVAQCALNQIVLFSTYLKVYFFPAWLNAFQTFRPVLTFSDQRFVMAGVLLAGFGALCRLLWPVLEHRIRPLFVLGVVWFFVTLSPVIVFFRRIGENVFAERYFYLPALGMCLAVSIAVLALPQRFKGRARVAIILVLLLFSARTVIRNGVWQDDLVFYESTVQASPNQGPLLINLGYAYVARGRTQEAITVLEQARALRPDIWQVHENLGRAYRELGRLDEALLAYEQATTQNPYRATAFADQASILAEQGKFSQAIAAYQKALDLDPQWEIYFNMARIAAAARKFPEAQQAYDAAARLNPSEGRVFAGMGDLWFAQSRYADAITAYKKALALNASDLRTWYNLADTCVFEKRFEEAIAAYEQALALSPQSAARARQGIETVRIRQAQSRVPTLAPVPVN